MKWRLASGVWCDKNVSPWLKGKLYRVVVRPTLLYGKECWLVKNTHVQRGECSYQRYDKERSYTWQGKSGLRGGQDEGSEIEMFRACEEGVHGIIKEV